MKVKAAAFTLEFRLFVHCVLSAKFAVFSDFELLWMRLFVFGRVVVSSATLFACQVNDISHILPLRSSGA